MSHWQDTTTPAQREVYNARRREQRATAAAERETAREAARRARPSARIAEACDAAEATTTEETAHG